MGFVDLHSHILPSLDDGAADAAESLAMLRGLAAVGFEAVCATPHQKAAQFLPDGSAVRQAYLATRTALAEAGVPLRLHLGAENFWDHVMFERLQEAGPPRYDDGRAFLFEIPTEDVPARLEDTLFQARLRGLLPVMAHPERYRPLREDPDRLARLGASCALVVDLGAVAGYHGWSAGRAARRMLQDGLVHAAASDAHGAADLRAAAEGIAWIKKKLGARALGLLLDENPRRIMAGELP